MINKADHVARHARVVAAAWDEVGAARQRVQSAFELVLLGPEVTNRLATRSWG